VIRVAFCCNDERGNHTEYVSAIDFGDSDIRIAGPDRSMRQVMFGVRIGRRKYETSGVWVSGAGNIFWDATAMPIDDARRLVQDLVLGGWQIEEHTCDGPFSDLVAKPVPTRVPGEGED
jgi:hypothetical protein